MAVPGLNAEAKRALSFDLASAHEALHQEAEALELYEAVGREDASFRDVAARVERLGGTLVQARPSQSRVAARTSPAAAASGKTAMRPAASAGSKVASSKPATTSGAANEPPDNTEPPRKNRKIGFV